MRIESSIERSIKSWVACKGGMVIKQNADLYKGIPDRLVIMPNGRTFFIEIKDPKGIVSELQSHWIKKLNSMAVNAYVVRSLERFKVLWNEEYNRMTNLEV